MAKTSATKPKEMTIPHDLETICNALKLLIKQGTCPPDEPSIKMWDKRALGGWYATCDLLSAMLTAYYGNPNPWIRYLTTWTPDIGDDPRHHNYVLGSLDIIQKTLECSK